MSSTMHHKREGERRPLSVMERINKTATVYVCYDCELVPHLVTPSLKLAQKYCRDHDMNYSIYAPGRYTED